MADKKLSALAATTTPALTDLLLTTVTPGGTPVSKSVTISDVLKLVYPIGCIYTTIVATNPATVFGFGTWAAFGAGKMLVGKDTGTFTPVEGTGGAETVTLDITQIPAHQHAIDGGTSAGGSGRALIASNTTASLNSNMQGGGLAHNNLPPYIVVYFWKRTA